MTVCLWHKRSFGRQESSGRNQPETDIATATDRCAAGAVFRDGTRSLWCRPHCDHLCQVTTIWSSDRYFGCIASNERPLPAIFADRLEQELSGKSLLIQGTSSLALESILSTPAQATRGQ